VWLPVGSPPRTGALDRKGLRYQMLVYRGPLALLAGAVLFAVMAISVKYAAAALPAGEIVMFRFLMGLAVLQILSGAGLIRVNHQRRSILIARGLTGALSISFYFASIKNTTLMKATLLSNAYPITTAVCSGGCCFARGSPALRWPHLPSPLRGCGLLWTRMWVRWSLATSTASRRPSVPAWPS